MEVMTEKLELQLDKSTWIPVKFGDIVKEPKENCKDPLAEGIEHVVGLEHITSGDIHLRNSASIEESTTFTKKFAKGDVLFGRRRAYLKKAAQANFDGICSGDITVFRAKPNLLPELLPFIVNNEKFFDYAVKHSAGGLSPRVKFKDLANYEFLLPPKAEQARLAKLLWAMDEVIEREKESFDKYELLNKRYLFDSVSGCNSKNIKNWKEYVFGSLGETFGGLNGKTKKDFGEGSPFINYMNVFKNSRIDPTQVDYVQIKKGEKQHEIKYGDIILTGSSETPDEVGMSSVVLDELNGYYLNSFCFGFRLNDFKTLLPEYARFLMRGNEVRSFMFKHAQGSTRFNLSKTTVKEKLRVFLPSLEEQKAISGNLEFMEEQLDSYRLKISSSQTLLKSLINQVF
jgi:type I restriction enzyme, S subunit